MSLSFYPLARGLLPALVAASVVSAWAAPASPPVPSPAADPQSVAQWCEALRTKIKQMSWKIDPCKEIEWQTGGNSVKGMPLVYATFGDPKSTNRTLVFSMVHGDENTPLYLGIQLAHWMREHTSELKDAYVVIAPLVNPDGFFAQPRTRVNARGVDVNRNFSTRDWHSHALKAWKNKLRSNPRRFPGNAPRSEPETIFQEELIQKVQPQKILSVHAPLNFMDYDGPTNTNLSLERFPKQYVEECTKLRARLKAISAGFFPGSLGNYAGQELGIPTLTLELPTANPAKGAEYWEKFKPGIHTMIQFRMPEGVANGLTPSRG